ncbi:hypothetical protein B0J14DRAFT_163622 [Halenospora varia]|nr:hypothetical protein B0J14DRAFT_163622 [Halenospora varia]
MKKSINQDLENVGKTWLGRGTALNIGDKRSNLGSLTTSPPSDAYVASFAVGLPSSLVEYLVLSEYATRKFLETTTVPAPRAFSYGICGTGTDHGTGVSFILMEELRGTSWTGQGVSGGEATVNKKAKVWRGLAEILIELEKHHFPKAGLLCLQSSEIKVSTVASDRFLVLTPTGEADLGQSAAS